MSEEVSWDSSVIIKGALCSFAEEILIRGERSSLLFMPKQTN